jgi:hypothetical protein
MNEAVTKLLRKYDTELERFTPKRVEDATDGQNSLGHLRWMISTMLEEGSTWSDRKVNRWLGFIQGTMWQAGVTGINKLRDESRHLYDGE